jgi:hypothetical protein
MLGLSLPIAATAVILIGQTATDAPPAFTAEIVQFEVQCLARLLVPSAWAAWARFPYQPGQKQVVVGKDPGEVVRINLETMTFYTMHKKNWPDEMPWERVTSMGVCKTVP